MEDAAQKEHDANPFLSAAVADLPALQAELTAMINHMATRIQYTETRRNTFAVVGGTVAAGGIAIGSLAVSQVSYLPLAAGLVVFGLSAVLTGLLTWVVYARQTNFTYPFLKSKAGIKSRKWFYHNALEKPKAFDSTIWGGLTKKMEADGKREFEDQWASFKAVQPSLIANLKENSYDDLKQIYLLHVNERYKNLFLTQLRQIISTGLILSVVVGVLAGIATAAYLNRPHPMHHSVTDYDGYTVESMWQRTNIRKTDSDRVLQTEVLFNAIVQNHSDGEVLLSNITARSRDGLQFPLKIEILRPSPISVGPHGSVNVDALILLPISSESELEGLELSR